MKLFHIGPLRSAGAGSKDSLQGSQWYNSLCSRAATKRYFGSVIHASQMRQPMHIISAGQRSVCQNSRLLRKVGKSGALAWMMSRTCGSATRVPYAPNSARGGNPESGPTQGFNGSAIFPYQENDRPHRPKKENRPQDISSTFRHPVRVEMHWMNGNSISLRLSFLVVHLQTLDLWT